MLFVFLPLSLFRHIPLGRAIVGDVIYIDDAEWPLTRRLFDSSARRARPREE